MSNSNAGLTAAQVEGMRATESVEDEIIRKGLSAPRVTPADIEAVIAEVYYLNAADAITEFDIKDRIPGLLTKNSPLKLLTLCLLVTKNGFTIVGKSACASAENFDRQLGERIALEDAKRQLWPLLGFALREKLAQGAVS